MEELDSRFFTRVIIDKYATLVLIDDFNCNLISTYVVEKLGLSVVDHPCPYEIMRYDQFISISKQVWVSFSLGKYKDSILCDVTHMDDCHLHFGNPWKRYRNVIHNPVNNSYRVVMERKYDLVPMSKEEAQEDIDRLKEWVKNWLDEKKDVVEEETVVAGNTYRHIVVKPIDDSCDLKLGTGNHEKAVENEIMGEERVMIEFKKPEVVQVVDKLTPIVGQIEL